jgi:hypothetical protein
MRLSVSRRGIVTSRLAVVALLLANGSSALHADGSRTTYECSIDSQSSHLSIDLGLSFPLDGTLIGDYDADTNPGGTRTVPGLFGGSGNNPIPFSAGLGGSIHLDGMPQSSMQLVIGNGPLAWVRDLSFDLLETQTAGVDLDVSIQFSTFRTFQPNSLYVGGIPLSIPVPVVEVTTIAFQQGPMADAVAIPIGPDRRWLTALVPGEITLVGSMLGEPMTFSAPFTVLLVGEMVWSRGGFTLAFSIADSGEFSIPLPSIPLPPIPLELPTIAPPGNTAGLIVTVALEGIGGNAAVDAEFVGAGQPTFSIADLNKDGLVDGLDLSELLGEWGAQGIADLNEDDIVNGADMMIMMSLW